MSSSHALGAYTQRWIAAAGVCALGIVGIMPANPAAADSFTPAVSASTAPAAAPDAIAPQVLGKHPTDIVGKQSRISVNFGAGHTGEVTIKDGDRVLGKGPVIDGVGEIDVTWKNGGAREIVASLLSIQDRKRIDSAPRVYQIVDLDREIYDIEVGSETVGVVSPQLRWSFGNYLNTDGQGFEKQVVEGNVNLLGSATNAQEKTNQEFEFHGGVGKQDVEGNTVIEYRGSVKLSYGKSRDYIFTDPIVTLDNEGYGYLTAVFTDSAADPAYQGKRRTIAQFDDDGMALKENQEGTVLSGTPLWDTATWEGTWEIGHRGSYPSDMLASVAREGREIWYSNGDSSDATKPPTALTVKYQQNDNIKVDLWDEGANHPGDIKGDAAEITTHVQAAAREGEVELFSDGELIGRGRSDVNGIASIKPEWKHGGSQNVSARFTADQGGGQLTSPEVLYRVVDPVRVVDDVEVSGNTKVVDRGKLSWSFGNYYSPFFNYGFVKHAVSGDVNVPEVDEEDGSAMTSAPIVFHSGVGSSDTNGNVHVKFAGTGAVTSGSELRWEFTDPEVYVGSDGHGYVTAIFTDNHADEDHRGKRVTVAEFTSATITEENGVTTVKATPMYSGHTAAGTWAADYRDAYPNSMLMHMSNLGRAFYHQTGASSDGSKQPLPLTFSYSTAPEPTPTQPAPTDPVPTQPVPTDPGPTGPVPSQPVPTATVTNRPPASPKPLLPVTGAGGVGLLAGLAVGAGALGLVIRRRAHQ